MVEDGRRKKKREKERKMIEDAEVKVLKRVKSPGSDLRRDTSIGDEFCPLTPSNWTAVWDLYGKDVKGIFNIPQLSPLSPHPPLGY
ncbi:hypothetical protein Nepgr_024627 [Nepenthes gracilis]|uniref:Uncharacterized protein n=1 Tax=Nepenthes gracilis TaxID=150966 RepID=A0AAD3Y077_NEPGR|nr:hypothetical protein Nepgr_024627 [Nepenthes gracilis]